MSLLTTQLNCIGWQAVKKRKRQEQAAIRKATLEKKAAAKRKRLDGETSDFNVSRIWWNFRLQRLKDMVELPTPKSQGYGGASDSKVSRICAERQVRTISRTWIADTFLEGLVQSWTKETLWKMGKFITDDQTMHQVMKKASKHFKVPAEEQKHWMATYWHIVRDGGSKTREVGTRVETRVKVYNELESEDED